MCKLSSSFRFSSAIAIAMAASFMLSSVAAMAEDEAAQVDDPAMQQTAAEISKFSRSQFTSPPAPLHSVERGEKTVLRPLAACGERVGG